MPEVRLPEMSVIEFFDRVYARYPRYWHHRNRDSIDPADFPRAWASLLVALRTRPPGRALDLGAGEGTDAIRLSRLGYEVDAVEGSAVGAAKIERFAHQAGVRVNVMHADATELRLTRPYDVILCNGLLHYVKDKSALLGTIQEATVPGGFNLVSLFTDYTPVPECHRVVDVFCDREEGVTRSAYADWHTTVSFDRAKPDSSHAGFPAHSHSMIKLFAEKPRS